MASLVAGKFSVVTTLSPHRSPRSNTTSPNMDWRRGARRCAPPRSRCSNWKSRVASPRSRVSRDRAGAGGRSRRGDRIGMRRHDRSRAGVVGRARRSRPRWRRLRRQTRGEFSSHWACRRLKSAAMPCPDRRITQGSMHHIRLEREPSFARSRCATERIVRSRGGRAIPERDFASKRQRRGLGDGGGRGAGDLA